MRATRWRSSGNDVPNAFLKDAAILHGLQHAGPALARAPARTADVDADHQCPPPGVVDGPYQLPAAVTPTSIRRLHGGRGTRRGATSTCRRNSAVGAARGPRSLGLRARGRLRVHTTFPAGFGQGSTWNFHPRGQSRPPCGRQAGEAPVDAQERTTHALPPAGLLPPVVGAFGHSAASSALEAASCRSLDHRALFPGGGPKRASTVLPSSGGQLPYDVPMCRSIICGMNLPSTWATFR